VLVDDLLEPASSAWATAIQSAGDRAIADADPVRLRQVLLNIVGTAIRYGGANGVVAIDVTEHEHTVRLAVRDAGAGIPPELMHRLFVPFDRLGAETGSEIGVGLGLVLSRRLIEAMAGQLRLDSVVSVGTTVTVELRRWVSEATDGTFR
jgi:signal transduction histidine kinase